MIGTSTGGRTARRAGLALLSTVLTVGAAVVVTGTSASAQAPSHRPYGHLASVQQVSSRYYQVSGWTVDPDSNRPLRVSVYDNGRIVRRATANRTSPSVPARYGNHGAAHGFVVDVPVGYGRRQICVAARSIGAGSSRRIGCRTRMHQNNPTGNLARVLQVPGGVLYAGTASDPNTNEPPTVSVTANGTQLDAALPANLGRHHNIFHGTHQLAEGSYKICATAKNLKWGRDAGVGCKTITLNYGPVGAITSLTQVPGGAKLSGWATDPDTSAPIQVRVVDTGKILQLVTADQAGGTKDGHEFTETYQLAQGRHTICLRGMNVGPGSDQKLACRRITLNFNPTATITSASQTMTGVTVVGTAVDPDTTDPISTNVTLDGKPAGSTVAGGGSGHTFRITVPAGAGKHIVCAVAVNVLNGTGNSPQVCKTITLNYDPVGAFENLARSSSDSSQLTVSGWALDLGSADPITVSATLDGKTATTATANGNRPDIAAKYPGYGAAHGFAFSIPADEGEHTVCLTAVNVGDGSDTSLGCQLIIAVHPTAPSAPQTVTAQGGYGGADVSWTAPADDGGAPPSSYVVTSSPGGVSTTVDGSRTSATVIGLKAKRSYTFSVVAVNVAGTSPAAVSAAVQTQASPPPQTSPAPVSTSRYIRNISNGSAAELATMRTEGATDAFYNPSGHGYLVLLDIGGQDDYDGGVVLSATTRFVSYSTLVADVKAYLDGYASKQKPSAPVVVAIGTNNDMDVTRTAGQSWANRVIDPIASYAKQYTGITIAGANDVEPGFRGGYSSTRAWLTGYLGATHAPFVFNGSADGCSPTAPGRHCNNGWSMAGLYQLAGGMAPTRIINLPQIYNTTMPRQWKYISLTGVNAGRPRINFGGPLTEWTACDQAGGCGSISGNSAWQQLWNQLQSTAALKVNSLPYSTDLRIDKP